MGRLNDFIKKLTHTNNNNNIQQDALSLSGAPTRLFKSDAEELWQSDTVQACISRCVAELVKYRPTHVQRADFGENYAISSDIQRVLDRPSAWHTQADLLEQTFYQYYLNSNAYIIPIYTNGKLEGLYAVSPQSVQHIEDAKGVEGYRMTFASGYCVDIACSQVIHLKRQLSHNDYFGGDRYGRADTQALRQATKLNDTLSTGISKTVESAYAVRGVLKLNSYLDEEKQQKQLSNFYKALRSNSNAFLVMDQKSTLEPLNTGTGSLVDANLLEYIDTKIARAYGVSLPILNGTANAEEIKAFQTLAIDNVVEKLEQELSAKLLTDKERKKGQSIQCYYRDTRYVDASTIETLKILLDAGGLTLNELRQACGLQPLQDLSTTETGKPLIMMSKNWGTRESVQNQVLVEADKTEKDKNTEE